MTTNSDFNDYETITDLLASNYLKGAISGISAEMKPTFHDLATWMAMWDQI